MIPLNPPRIKRAVRWFDVRHRRTGMWAYSLNRITSIILFGYLYLHLAVLSILARGPGSWDSFMSLARSRVFLSLDVFLLAAILIHGLNGVRVVLTGMGYGVRMQKLLFAGVMLLAVLLWGTAAIKIYGS
ncbi:MAG TPA: succinate dehydrogenase, cytochrome b556 subunit [Chloroflexota bacterium]